MRAFEAGFRAVMVCSVLAAAGRCKSVHPGIMAGVPITQYFETVAAGGLHGSAEYSAATRRYTVGLSLEVRLTGRLGFEVDALYHRMGYVAIVASFDSATGRFQNSAIDVKGNSWDFPLLVKRRFGRVVRPYVLGGAVMRYVGPVRGRGQQTVGSLVDNSRNTTVLDTSDPSELRKRFYQGVTVGAGVETPVGRLRVIPEVRWAHWTANISGEGGLLRFAPNQVEVYVGVRF